MNDAQEIKERLRADGIWNFHISDKAGEHF
jgi:hypothetical protein